ncbi:helix-turn-helix domain-containing protein [Mesorhizobium sp.]|uniref:helix-turn-helix domain-containing protein n=1 Tax=Mesorhizobium sp. TaxID=1871066 RepID=UPI00122BFA7F|nr:helix-turn-helix domain-containing protein [Mesorhizobium sp.]TIP07587.1 MAG: helix-turn-helix domain-containing protein [Mesorhizobium sp.]
MTDTTNIYEEMPDLDTSGGRLSRAREASGLSVKQLAWRLGVKMATINAWESDRSQPGSHRLANLSGILDVSISWILHGVGTAPSEPESGEMAESLNSKLCRLKLLHAETGHLISRVQDEMERLDAGR